MTSIRWLWMGVTLWLLLLVLAALAVAGEPIRVDTFDKDSRRTGYILIDPKTGRVDMFDTRSRRTGSGQVTPAPAAGSSSGTTRSTPTPPRR